MPNQLRLGCGEWGFRDLPMAQHFAICKRLGFGVMEIGLGGGRVGRLPERMADDQIDVFRKLRDGSGLTTPYCCIENDFTLADAAAHDAVVTSVLDQMRTAKRLGSTHIRLFAGFTPIDKMTGPIWERLLDALSRCADAADKLGQVIALETHGAITLASDGSAVHAHTITTDRDALARLIDQMPASIGFNYDPGNIKAAEPGDTRYCLDLLDGRINYCHLKDWQRTGAGWTAVAPGGDDLDYAAMLPKMSYDGVCLIEYEPTEDIEDGIVRSLAYLRSLGMPVELAGGGA